MILPRDLQLKIENLTKELKIKDLSESRQNLTARYKNETGRSKSLINKETDSVVYAISRMPATYAVVHDLIVELVEEGKLDGVQTVVDFGSGTGAGYFAIKDIFDDVCIDLVERDVNMIKCFDKLSDGEVKVETRNIFDYLKSADLVLTSYVLSEMLESDRFKTIDKLLEVSNKYLLIIDTGTPQVYQDMMKIKEYVYEKGFFVTAPCMSKNCGLKDDYCQFFARVERSSLHKQLKSGTLSYEDEKYFYLLIEKKEREIFGERIIRRPIFKENMIEVKVCSNSGVKNKVYTKKDKELFKKVKKTKINQIV